MMVICNYETNYEAVPVIPYAFCNFHGAIMGPVRPSARWVPAAEDGIAAAGPAAADGDVFPCRRSRCFFFAAFQMYRSQLDTL
mgnify:CR=1 FL=1